MAGHLLGYDSVTGFLLGHHEDLAGHGTPALRVLVHVVLALEPDGEFLQHARRERLDQPDLRSEP